MSQFGLNLKKKDFVEGKSPKNIEFLKNKDFKEKSSKNFWIPILAYYTEPKL
jgi:hypothetical protein